MRPDRRTDGRTDGHGDSSIPPLTSLRGVCDCETRMPPVASKSKSSKISVIHFDPARLHPGALDASEV